MATCKHQSTLKTNILTSTLWLARFPRPQPDPSDRWVPCALPEPRPCATTRWALVHRPRRAHRAPCYTLVHRPHWAPWRILRSDQPQSSANAPPLRPVASPSSSWSQVSKMSLCLKEFWYSRAWERLSSSSLPSILAQVVCGGGYGFEVGEERRRIGGSRLLKNLEERRRAVGLGWED
jgi:hypothetical protein